MANKIDQKIIEKNKKKLKENNITAEQKPSRLSIIEKIKKPFRMVSNKIYEALTKKQIQKTYEQQCFDTYDLYLDFSYKTNLPWRFEWFLLLFLYTMLKNF